MKIKKLILLTFIAFLSSSIFAQEAKKAPKPEKMYLVHDKGTRVSKVEIRKDAKATGNVIQIETLNVTGGSISLGRATAGSPVLPPAEITNFALLEGSFASSREISRSGRSVIVQYLDVVFPFRARMSVAEQIFEFEIKEKGSWKVIVGVTL